MVTIMMTIKNYKFVIKVWDYTFKLSKITPEEHPIIMCEPPSTSKKHQECMMEIMMEKYETPAYYVASQAVMCLYSCGRITGDPTAHHILKNVNLEISLFF